MFRPDIVRRLHAELRHLLDVPLDRPIENAPQVQQPGEQPFLGMKTEFEQRPRRFAAGLHRVLTTRQLEVSVHLKTTRATKQILRRNPPRHDVSRGADGKRACAAEGTSW